MRKQKVGLSVFGLAFVTAFGMMAFVAIAAQAEFLTDGGKAASFLVAKETALAKPGVNFATIPAGKVTLSVPGRNLDILCVAETLTGEYQSSLQAKALFEFSTCSASEHGLHTKSLPCTVVVPIITELVIIRPKKHEGAPYLQLTPSFTKFATVELIGAECALPKKSEVTGTLGAEVTLNDTFAPTVKSSEAIQSLLGDKLTFGVFSATLQGESTVKLTDLSHLFRSLGVC